MDISWQSFFSALVGKNTENIASTLIWDLRIPRFLMALLAGGCLAVAGQSMQILVRNPLADPYTMGTAGGASLGVNLAILGLVPSFLQFQWMIPFWGFLGAIGAISLVLLLVSGKRRTDSAVLLLIGIAVSILTGSLISLITYWAAKQNEVRHLLFWAFGNLDKSNWVMVIWVSVIGIPLLLGLHYCRSWWAILTLGDEKVSSFALSAGGLKRSLLIISALFTALVVCSVGPIGFVGLIVPFWVRKFYSLQDPGFWLMNFIVGGSFLSICDLIARLLMQPSGLPIGLITSLLGLPFFVYLLRENARQARI